MCAKRRASTSAQVSIAARSASPSPCRSFLSRRLTPSCGRAPIALLQRAEQRAVVALREAVLELVERVVHLLARGRGFEQARGAVLLGVPHDLVHADARDRELRAASRVDVAAARPCRRSAAAGPTRVCAASRSSAALLEDRRAGAGRRQQRLDRAAARAETRRATRCARRGAPRAPRPCPACGSRP